MKTKTNQGISELSENSENSESSPKSSESSPQPSRLLVRLARILVGAVFILSGFVKLIDLWGFVFKIEEYLEVWGILQPRSVVFVVAFLLSGAEFTLGALLAAGCYKRAVPALLLCVMAGMLPLSLYIYIADPVADCGCFGDFWVISNAATFWKNVAITALLLFLLLRNRTAGGWFSPPVQWLVVTLLGLYAMFVGFFGYYIQPMIDFRSFPPGSSLAESSESSEYSEISENSERSEYSESSEVPGDAPEFVFIYRNDATGEAREFGIDDIPEEGWTFVDRRQISGEKVDSHATTDFVILRDDEDVTSEAVTGHGIEMLLLIPDLRRADVAYTYPLNELNSYLVKNDGRMAALIGSGSRGLAAWSDLSMASYPLFSAEPTLVKELGRGDMSLVYLRDGVIQWKRALHSIDSDLLSLISSSKGDPAEVIEAYDPYVTRRLIEVTLLLIGALAVVWILDKSGRSLSLGRRRKKKRTN